MTAITKDNNDPIEVKFDPNNQCRGCGRRAGKYRFEDQIIGIYLTNEHLGGKVCNLCLQTRQFIYKRKMGKKEKKAFKKMIVQSRKTLEVLKHIPPSEG